MVLGERLGVTIEKIPVESGERAGIVADPLLRVIDAALAELGHAVQVSPAGRIGLGHQHSVVCVHCHADHVRNHHPVRCVDELFAHPVEKLLRVGAGDKGQVAEHHQSRNVMHPGALLDVGHHPADASHLGFRRVGEGRQQVAVGTEAV